MRLKEDTPRVRQAIRDEANMLIFNSLGDTTVDKYRNCAKATGLSVQQLKNLGSGRIPTGNNRSLFYDAIGKPDFIENIADEVSVPTSVKLKLDKEETVNLSNLAYEICDLEKEQLAKLLMLIAVRLEEE